MTDLDRQANLLGALALVIAGRTTERPGYASGAAASPAMGGGP